MTKVTSNKPTKTSPLGGAALGALGNIDKQTTAINQALLTMMPASSVESTKAGNAPAIPAAEQAASTKAIKNIITELKEIQGMTALASFIAITLEADQPKDTKLVEDIAQIAQDVTKLLADPKMGAAKATLATNLDAKVGKNIVSLAKENLDTDEQNAIDAAIPGGVFSNDGAIDISAILILMITLNAKLRKTEQDSSIATAKAQSDELKKAADKMVEAAKESFTSALTGGLISIGTATASIAMAGGSGIKQAAEKNKIQKDLGPEPIEIPKTAPKKPPMIGTEDEIKMEVSNSDAFNQEFKDAKTEIQTTLKNASGEDKDYLRPENGSLTDEGLKAYADVKSAFKKYVSDNAKGGLAGKKLATTQLFDSKGKLTKTGQVKLKEYTATLTNPKKDAVNNLLQYTPDEINESVAYPKQAANYLKYTKGIEEETNTTRRSALIKERDQLTQASKMYDDNKQNRLQESNTSAQRIVDYARALGDIGRSSDSMTQSSLNITAEQSRADSQKEEADAQMIGATKQNIDATTQNIDSTVSAMIQLLTQYLQGVNQTASNAARLV